MDSFDYETFISLVEDREVLWDKTLEIYKDKRKSLKAWFEICHIMNENFADLPDTEKNKYGKYLFTKFYLFLLMYFYLVGPNEKIYK